MRDDHGHLRKRQRGARQCERVTEAKIEAAGQPELLANADRQDAAMDEDGGAVFGGGQKDTLDALVVVMLVGRASG